MDKNKFPKWSISNPLGSRRLNFMNPDIQQLQSQIDALQKKLDNLSSPSTIDRNIETALRERLGLPNPNFTGTFTYVSNVVLNNLGGGSYSLTKTTKTLTFNSGILISNV